MKYYLHDTSAFEDEKITQLYKQFGYEGLGLFYTALEKMAKQEKPVKTEVLKFQLKVGKKLEKCWKFMESLDILSSNNGETFNKQLLKFSEKYAIKKEKNTERISKWRENQALKESVTHYESVSNAPKDKISKDKISKVNVIKELPEPLPAAPLPIENIEIIEKEPAHAITEKADNSNDLIKKVEINDNLPAHAEKEPALYTRCVDVYFAFFRKNFGGVPKFDGAQGKALKEIIKYWETNSKDIAEGQARDLAVLAKWTYLLDNWDKLDNFHQNQTKLSQISSNIQNLIVQIKAKRDGKQTNQANRGNNNRNGLANSPTLNEGKGFYTKSGGN